MSKNNTILMDGADGFNGSHLIEALVRQGYHMRAFVVSKPLNSYNCKNS